MTASEKRVSMTNSVALFATLGVIALIVATLHAASEVFIPIALAALLTFLLAPLVTRLERWIGRSTSVALVLVAFTVAMAVIGWTIAGQFFDLAKQLPDYENNIITKVRSLPMPRSRTFAGLSKMLDDLKKEFPSAAQPGFGKQEPKEKGTGTDPSASDTPRTATESAPLPVKVVENADSSLLGASGQLLETFFSPLGKAALVILLLACMLAQREDLRNRFIRLVGQGHISTTSKAMDDAGQRVSRYLVMQFAMNSAYGVLLAAGLYFIGVPNALLWGVFAALLRYIPYVGIWIAAAFPLVLSLAVSKGWTMPALTLSLFIALEIVCANLLEPLVYGSSTGVSSVALILAAVFWTWVWGPAGLVLSTPLTVCLVVIGTHVRKLEFLSILLSDEKALTPADDLYFRLLSPSDQDEMELVDACLKRSTITEVYDTVLLPVTANAGIEAQLEAIDPGRIGHVEEGLRNILQELRERPQELFEKNDKADETESPSFPACRVLCLPAHSERDALAGSMLEHLLALQGCEAHTTSGTLISGELVGAVEKFHPDLVCISTVVPSTMGHARYLCVKIRKQFPKIKIIVGLWGPREDDSEAKQRLRNAGADEIACSLEDAVVALRKNAPRIETAMVPAPLPQDELARLHAIRSLKLDETVADKALDKITARAAKDLDMPIGFVGLVNHDRLVFLSQTGLPEPLAESREAPREATVCGHVVAEHDMIVVEDLARDPRFANNPWLRQHGMRFYAGVPLRTPEGLIFGTLCVMDRKPRTFTEHDREQLQHHADDVVKQIEGRANGHEDLATRPAA